MNSLVIILLLILIVLTVHSKLNDVNPPNTVLILPTASFCDIKGKCIKGNGMTSLTTPRKKPCSQLLVKPTQETRDLDPMAF